MRIDAFIALCLAGFAAPYALAEGTAPPAAPPANVTVNLGALPIPLPRHKPTPAEMRALLAPPMPRPKPTLASLALLVPMPRAKPQLAAVQPKPANPKPPLIGTEAAPAHETALTSPQGAASIAAALLIQAVQVLPTLLIGTALTPALVRPPRSGPAPRAVPTPDREHADPHPR